MEYGRPRQLGGRHGHLGADRGHPQRDGYWIRQQADHTHHRGDQLWDTGGQHEVPEEHDHLHEPPGRARGWLAVLGECVLQDDQVRREASQVNHQAVDMYEGEWLESVLMMLACHGMQGDAESSSIITAATKMDNIAVPMIDKKWLKDGFAMMNCFGTQGYALK